MAFIDIEDPAKRDAIVADYLSTIRHIRERNENDKAIGLARQIHLEQTFKPIVSATEKATTAITNEIKAEKNHHSSHSLLNARKKRKFTHGSEFAHESEFNAFDYYQKMDKKDLDKYFAIQRIGDNELMLGDKEVVVDNDSNITVDDEKMYRATPGLWSLIMLAAQKSDSYSDDDIRQYTDLARRTNLIDSPHNVDQNSRVMQTKKYKMLEELMKPKGEQEEEEDEEEEEEDEKEDEEVKREASSTATGSGVQFLPGDIKGLQTKLNLLLGEYRAGNKSSTRNQIVSILDELKRRKRLSKKDYREINTFIAPP